AAGHAAGKVWGWSCGQQGFQSGKGHRTFALGAGSAGSADPAQGHAYHFGAGGGGQPVGAVDSGDGCGAPFQGGGGQGPGGAVGGAGVGGWGEVVGHVDRDGGR